MKVNISKFKVLATLSAFALVTACGGGGGGSGGSPSTISGRVIDGYIENALVCLDVNNNLRCDPGEPEGRTDSEGRYTLDYSGSIDGLVVLAVVGTDAIDSDLGPVQKAFNLFTPAESAEVITPITTLVKTEMISRGLTASEAEDAVRATLSIPAGQKVLGYDFVAAGDNKTLAVAQVLAASFAVTKEALVDEGLTPRQLALATVREVSTNVVPAVISSDGSSRVQISARTNQTELITQVNLRVSDEVTLTGGTSLTGRIQQIVAASKLDSKVVDAKQVFKDGFVIASEGSGDYLEDGNRVGMWSGYTNQLEAEYIVFDADKDAAVRWMQKVWLSDKQDWYHKFDNDDDQDSILIDGKWEKISGEALDRSENISFNRNCLSVAFKKSSSLAEQFCLVEKDVSGELVSKYLKISNTTSSSAVFPVGSKAYDLTFSATDDLYQLWGSSTWSGYSFEGIDFEQPQNNKPTLALFIKELFKDNQWVGSNCNVGFKVKSYNAATKKGVMQWAANPSKSCSGGGGQPNFTNAEETDFELDTVAGKELMFVNYPNLYRQLNPGDGIGGKKLFGVKTNTITVYYDPNSENRRVYDPESTSGLTAKVITVEGIYSGEFVPKGSAVTLTFNGDVGASAQVVNRTLFDAALQAVGIKPFVYTDFLDRKK